MVLLGTFLVRITIGKSWDVHAEPEDWTHNERRRWQPLTLDLKHRKAMPNQALKRDAAKSRRAP